MGLAPTPAVAAQLSARRRLVYWAGAAALALAPLCWFVLLDLLFPFPWANLQRPAAVVVSDRAGEPLRFFLPADERWRMPVKLEELPADLPKALVASEDRRFWRHPGVDPWAIGRAAWANLRRGEVVSGASTIPMQIARMADPGPRTLATKIREAFRALQLERRYSKNELLEVYLNLTPYGGNVEGVGAASWFYFGKEPDRLSLGEIALLTALPRSPVRYDPTLHPAAALAARDRVLAQLAERRVFGRRQLREASAQPLPRARRTPPFAAPHFAGELVKLLPGEARIRSSLDRGMQQVAESQVARRALELRAQGIGNAAVVVIENESRAVRAFVGSAGFFDTYFQGQVDGVVAPRSPGSTLKPFLYALAVDSGRVLPDSYILDVPTDFAGYVAENYDGRYRGRVTVREALVQSLNACAVRLLARVGLDPFLKTLRRGGLATLDQPAGRYGLPLILGAGEVRLLDLANLYASLAQGGLYRPVRMIEPLEVRDRRGRIVKPEAAGPEDGERLFSRDAARAIAEILTDVRRPDLPESWDLARGVPPVAWKTGTSYGHRDAWAIGFSRRLTIGVWVGNFNGRPRLGISGSQHAGPLLFDLFRALDPGGKGPVEADPRPPSLENEIEVCALSHELPGPFCPDRARIAFLSGKSSLVPCTIHRRVLVDRETGDLLAGDCMNRRPHEFRILTLHPPELVAWWRSQGAPDSQIAEPPRLSPECSGIPDGDPPKIVSPDEVTAYHLRKGVPADFQRIPLVAQTAPGVSRLFWYQDGTLVATTAPADGQNRFLDPVRGAHRLVVTDDLGRSDGITYRVE